MGKLKELADKANKEIDARKAVEAKVQSDYDDKERAMRSDPERNEIIGKIRAWAKQFVASDDFKAARKTLESDHRWSVTIFTGPWGHFSLWEDHHSCIDLDFKGNLSYTASGKYGPLLSTEVTEDGDLSNGYVKLLWKAIQNGQAEESVGEALEYIAKKARSRNVVVLNSPTFK